MANVASCCGSSARSSRAVEAGGKIVDWFNNLDGVSKRGVEALGAITVAWGVLSAVFFPGAERPPIAGDWRTLAFTAVICVLVLLPVLVSLTITLSASDAVLRGCEPARK